MSAANGNHDAPPEALAVAGPLREPEPARRRTPAEEARTLVAVNSLGTLSTLTAGGDPWGSLVAYGQLADGSPVLLVSTLAEHGRNLPLDGRASLVVAEGAQGGDPLDSGRVTLAGRAERPADAEADEARAAFLGAVETAHHYVDFGDFALYVLRVDRVRWVGGYGRMDSPDAADYRTAEPDPVAGSAAYAVRHLNEDHADAAARDGARPRRLPRRHRGALPPRRPVRARPLGRHAARQRARARRLRGAVPRARRPAGGDGRAGAPVARLATRLSYSPPPFI